MGQIQIGTTSLSCFSSCFSLHLSLTWMKMGVAKMGISRAQSPVLESCKRNGTVLELWWLQRLLYPKADFF